ncbi:DUF3592 domain-containing protein [uncultured Cedecea sp.]|uniref:DUF3592 domain-containing protein n=1 Tax=uncultured Cedecea sp. TaxID=988762 RepID=UPI002636E60D|nr:DUF3592 domain-containing protein [uncultured Cedecea sp.]
MKTIFGAMRVIGLLLLCLASYFAYTNYAFQQEALHAEGKITDLRYSRSDSSSSPVWYPEVTFIDDAGKTVIFKSSVGSSSYRKSLGENVDVIYRKNASVTTAQINSVTSFYFDTIFSAIFGAVFLFIGAIGYALSNKAGRYRKLLREGKPLETKIVNVELNTAISVNGRSPWRIVSQWLDPQTHQIYVFSSENFNYDPSPYIQNDKITVYVAHNNYKKYFVDTSHFPEKIPDEKLI